MAQAQVKKIGKVRITADTFISGAPIKAGTIVPNEQYPNVTQQDMKDLILYNKAEEYKGSPEAAAGKAGK